MTLALFFALPVAASAQYVSPYVIVQGSLSTSSGLPAKNATLSFAPSQTAFVAGTSVVVSQGQCSTDSTGQVVGVPNPAGAPRVSAEYVGTLPAGTYYVEYTWYDEFGGQTLPSVEVAQTLTGAGELQVLPPIGAGPPTATGMYVYIGSTPGGETFQGETTSLTAQFTRAAPLGQSVGGITIGSGGEFDLCPAAFTFSGGYGAGAQAQPVCTAGGGNYTITGVTGFLGGYGYVSAPAVGTTGVPSVAPVLTASLIASPVPPIRNLTSCRVVANDAEFPTGTGYTVSLVDASGNTLFSYPEMWQFFGPGSAYNLSQGIPYYHGQVTYPIPILTIPYNHNPQSISGPLSLSGYNLTGVGALGVGTALPAWGVDVEGSGLDADINAAGTINSGQGFTYGLNAPSNHILLGNGTAYVDSATLPCTAISGLTVPCGTASAVTFSAGPAAGSGATVSCATSHTCNSIAGTVTIGTGTGTSATNLLASVNWPTIGTLPTCLLTFTPAPPVDAYWYPQTTALGIYAGATAWTASTTYTLNYLCVTP